MTGIEAQALAERALREYAAGKDREAARRSSSGPFLAGHRARLREEARRARELADGLHTGKAAIHG